MHTPLPFKVSPDAELWFLRVPTILDKQPGISRTGADGDKYGEPTKEFSGEHYSIVYDSPERWVAAHGAVCLLIAHREFWIPPDTLETLRGKTLAVAPRDGDPGKHAGEIGHVLVVT
jgi:hypothetical protein